MSLPSILVVEDDPTFRRIVTRFLQECCSDEVVVLDAVEGGFEALVKAHTLGSDIVLIDLLLPDLHGLDVISRLHRAFPHIRIIAISQHDVDSYRQASLEAGAEEFIPKAVLNTALLPVLRRIRATWQPRQGPGGSSGESGRDPGVREGNGPHELDQEGVMPSGGAGGVDMEGEAAG